MTERILGSDTFALTWNTENMPLLITKKGTNLVSFTYDGSNRRIRKHTFLSGTDVLYFGEVYEKRGTTGVIHLFTGSTRVVSLTDTGGEQSSHPNHLGSASMITDGNGFPKQKVEYYPFGTYRRTGNDQGTWDYPNNRDAPLNAEVHYTFTDQEDDDELPFYNFKARLYDPLLGRFISPDSIVQAPGDPQTLNRYSYCGNNPLVYTDPSGHIFGIDDVLIGMAIGAIIGAGMSAVTGGNVLTGAITGAVSGAFFGVAGGIITEYGLQGSLTAVTLHAAAGAASGGINAGITVDNVGLGALTGGIAGGLGACAGPYLKDLGYPAQVAGRALVGGVSGGIGAELAGGDFGQGFVTGATTGAIGAVANDWLHEKGLPWLRDSVLPKAKEWVNSRIGAVAEGYNNIRKPGVELLAIDFEQINFGQLALGSYQTLDGFGAVATGFSFPVGCLIVPGGGPAAATAVALTVSPALLLYGGLELLHGPSNIKQAVGPAVSTYRLDFVK
jgi:RHS repeat-associated protein